MPKIKELLARGEFVRLFGLGAFKDPRLVEIVGEHGGFDGFWLDGEHSWLDARDVELLVMAARSYGLDHFVRLPATDYATIMRVLEAGAGGVMISMVQSAADARQAVRWAKFHPSGMRGINGNNRDGRHGLLPTAEYVTTANAKVFVGIQIETRGGIDEVEAIAAIPEVDLLFVGPADISQVLGIPGQFHDPRCIEVIDRIAAACKAAGKPWGIVPHGDEYARHMADQGCRMFVLGFDNHAFHAGIRASKEKYAMFFPKGSEPAAPAGETYFSV